MAAFIWTNDASSTLAAPLSNVGTTLNVAVGTGALFPNPGVGQQFSMTFTDAATGLDKEIVYVTARSGDSMTIVRAQEGTSAQNWSAGDLCANLITAGAMNSFFQSATYQGQQTTAYFEYVSTTSAKLIPSGGNTIIINGSVYQIPAAGLALTLTNVYVNGVAAQNLAASTLYEVYVMVVAGNLVFDCWSTGTHITDTTSGNVGVEVRSNGGSPDGTRSYVGIIKTDAVPHFQTQGLGTLSWFNRQPLILSNLLVSASTASTSAVELNTAARNHFLNFAGQNVSAIMICGSSSNSIATDGTSISLTLAGVAVGQGQSGVSAAAGAVYGLDAFAAIVVGGGENYVTPFGNATAGGTASFSNVFSFVTTYG